MPNSDVAKVTRLLDSNASNNDIAAIYRQLEAADIWLELPELVALVDELNSAQRWPVACALQWYLADQMAPGRARDGWLFTAGVAAMDAGQFELARTLMEQVIERSSVEGHHCLYAHLLLVLDEPEQALVAAEKSVALDPKFGEGWYRLGVVRRALEQHSEANAAFAKAFELEPDREIFIIEHAGAVVLSRRDQADPAEFERMRAKLAPIAARKDNFFALVYWSQYERVARNEAGAEAALCEAKRLDPDSPIPYTWLALCFRDWGRSRAEFDELLTAVRARALEFAESDPELSEEFSNAAERIEHVWRQRE